MRVASEAKQRGKLVSISNFDILHLISMLNYASVFYVCLKSIINYSAKIRIANRAILRLYSSEAYLYSSEERKS